MDKKFHVDTSVTKKQLIYEYQAQEQHSYTWKPCVNPYWLMLTVRTYLVSKVKTISKERDLILHLKSNFLQLYLIKKSLINTFHRRCCFLFPLPPSG